MRRGRGCSCSAGGLEKLALHVGAVPAWCYRHIHDGRRCRKYMVALDARNTKYARSTGDMVQGQGTWFRWSRKRYMVAPALSWAPSWTNLRGVGTPSAKMNIWLTTVVPSPKGAILRLFLMGRPLMVGEHFSVLVSPWALSLERNTHFRIELWRAWVEPTSQVYNVSFCFSYFRKV